MDIPKIEVKQPKPLLLLDEDVENELPNVGSVPKPPKKKKYSLDDYYVLKRLKDNVPLVGCASASCPSGFTDTQKEMFAIMSNYSDLYYPEADYNKFEEIRTVYAVHALNHVLKTRKRVLRHNSKISKERAKKKKKKKGEVDAEQCYRDQGYTRPKVLIVIPFKHSAYRLVFSVLSLVL